MTPLPPRSCFALMQASSTVALQIRARPSSFPSRGDNGQDRQARSGATKYTAQRTHYDSSGSSSSSNAAGISDRDNYNLAIFRMSILLGPRVTQP